MLFQYQKFSDGGTAAIDTVVAPLSPVRFSLSMPGWSSCDQPPDYVHKLTSEATVSGWRLEKLHIELLLCHIDPQLPNGRTVDGCAAAVFRVRAHEPLEPLSFNARLLSAPEATEIGPESGEGIDAQSWTASRNTLMLSTEDGDLLAQRAKERDWMPFRLQSSLASRFPQYLPDGLTVNVPRLDSAELCQVQFVMSWSNRDQSDNSAWMAVDRLPGQILSAAGCS